MNKQHYTLLRFLVLLAIIALVYINAFAQDTQPSDKVVKSFVDKMEHGKDSVDFYLYVTIMQLERIAGDAYQYKIRPTSIGGGEGSYSNYTLHNSCPDSRIGSVVAQAPDSITFRSRSQKGFGDVWVTVDKNGKLSWRFTDNFYTRFKKMK